MSVPDLPLATREFYEQEFKEFSERVAEAAKDSEVVASVLTHEGSEMPGLMSSPVLGFSDMEPGAWRRSQNAWIKRNELQTALKESWAESTSGVKTTLPIPGLGDTGSSKAELDRELLVAQGECKQTQELIERVRNNLATGVLHTGEDSKKGVNSTPDYRFHATSGVLERSVVVTGATIWVPVLPGVNIRPELFAKARDPVTWRRYAFECAHTVFLEPHRGAEPTWQALRRMGYWPGMHATFNGWISACTVCAQFRTVGHLQPMRSTLGSLDQFKKLPWRDVIIDCQGPFTKSSSGNCYVVSYHCTFFGVCKLEPLKV